MKKLNIILFAFTLIFIACNSADKQAPEIAQDFCNCFTPLTNKLGPEAREIVIKAANEADYVQAMQQELARFSDEEKMQISEELMVFAEINSPSSTVNTCIKNVQDKYKNALTTDKEAFMKKIIDELEKKDDCKVTAALLKVGLQVEGTK